VLLEDVDQIEVISGAGRDGVGRDHSLRHGDHGSASARAHRTRHSVPRRSIFRRFLDFSERHFSLFAFRSK